MHYKKITRLGKDVIEIQEYGFALFGAPGKARKRKEGKTDAQAKKANEKSRARRMQRLFLANFTKGDLHVIMNFLPGKEPETYEEARKGLRDFLRRLRRYYNKRGHELKCVAVTERGKRKAALHHHLVINSIDDNNLCTMPAIMACWDGGKVSSSSMYEDGNFEKLAEYILKAGGKEENCGAAYYRSRNLKEPEPERILKIGNVPTEQKAPEGWYVVKDSVEEGINPYSQKRYQRYLLRRNTPVREQDARVAFLPQKNRQIQKKKTRKPDTLIGKAASAARSFFRRKRRHT